jgi:hypothetical protein
VGGLKAVETIQKIGNSVTTATSTPRVLSVIFRDRRDPDLALMRAPPA